MSDGREEREQGERQLEEERRKDRQHTYDLLERDLVDEWEPERGGS